MLTSRGVHPEKISEAGAVRLAQRGLLETKRVLEVLPPRLRLAQLVDEGVTSISQVVEVVERFNIQDRYAKVVGYELFPVAGDLVGLPLLFDRVEGDG